MHISLSLVSFQLQQRLQYLRLPIMSSQSENGHQRDHKSPLSCIIMKLINCMLYKIAFVFSDGDSHL